MEHYFLLRKIISIFESAIGLMSFKSRNSHTAAAWVEFQQGTLEETGKMKSHRRESRRRERLRCPLDLPAGHHGLAA